MPMFTRRSALFAAAAAPVTLAAPLKASAAGHEGGGPVMSKARAFKLGGFRVTTILAGSVLREEPQGIFGMNVSAEEFAGVSEENFISTEAAQFFFTPTVVDTGAQVVLFDTGLNAAGTTAALAEAGYAPGDVTHVVLTHMHGDHVGGLTTEDGALTYPEATIIAGQAEFDYWAGAGSDAFEGKVRPNAERITFVGDGAAVAPGITGMAAFGHTPGHMVYMIESEGQQLLIAADTANHYVWSLGYPDWEVRFDIEKDKAAAVRRQLFGMLAADKIPFVGYHMPFPAAGYVQTRDDGFRYVPVSYQMMG